MSGKPEDAEIEAALEIERETSQSNHWYAEKTRNTRAFLAQLRPNEDGQLPGYDWERKVRRRKHRRRLSGTERLFRRVRDWWYRISSPLP